jgi:hypothetical protein
MPDECVDTQHMPFIETAFWGRSTMSAWSHHQHTWPGLAPLGFLSCPALATMTSHLESWRPCKQSIGTAQQCILPGGVSCSAAGSLHSLSNQLCYMPCFASIYLSPSGTSRGSCQPSGAPPSGAHVLLTHLPLRRRPPGLQQTGRPGHPAGEIDLCQEGPCRSNASRTSWWQGGTITDNWE